MSAKSFMQKPTYKRMLIAILVGMMLTATSAIASVKASPAITVTVSPTSGPVGSTMTVSGINASSNGEVRIFLVGFIFLATTMANETGGYSINITVPAIPADVYDVMVLDVETGETASDTFTVQPKIVLDHEEGSYMDNVTVKGYGFDVSVLITLTFDGIDVTPTPQPETDMLGSFEAKFSVPSTPNGTYTVTADDGTNNASALFTVIPKITLSPKTSGPPGTLVIVTGTGFSPSVNVTIEFDTINVTNYWGVTTWADGSFGLMWMPALFFVPEVSDGAYIVKATDEDGNSATAPFLVPSPVMTLEPSTTFGSSTVTARGSGFPPNQPVLLYLEDNLLVNLMEFEFGSQRLFADEYGSYEYSFVVPVTKPGVYTVMAYSVSGDGGLTLGEELASASLTIVEDPTLEDIEGNLTDINARLVSIDGSIATIETDIGTIEVDISDIQEDVSDVQAKTVPAGYELAVASTILALIAAIGAWISAILIQRKTPSTPKAKSK